MSGPDKLLAEIQQQARAGAFRVASHFGEVTRPRVARLLEESALVAVRKAAGQDTTTAEVALEASLANLTLEEKSVVQIEARDVAFRALVAVVGMVAGGA